MATIVKRSSGKWQVKIRRKGSPDVSKTFDLRADAERWARGAEREVDLGIWAFDRKLQALTLRELVARYLKDVTPTKRGAFQEQFKLRAVLRHELADYAVSKISPTLIAKWRDDRLNEVAPGTVNRELNVLGHLFEVARKEWGVSLPANPVQLTRRPKNPPGRDRRFENDEEARLLEAAGRHQNVYLRPMIFFAANSAMREGELVKLLWADADLKKGIVRIKASDTKTEKARTIPLTKTAIEELARMPRSICGRIFPVTIPALLRGFNKSCQRAGITDFKFHDLRHEATSRFFEAGFDIMEVASVTGHETLQMLKRYTHLRAAKLVSKLAAM